jgi:type I restriction enzyme S subunit
MSWAEIEFEGLYASPSRNGLTRPARIRGAGYKMINMGELFAHDRIGNIEMERVPMNETELANMLVENGDLLFARQSLVLAGAGKCSLIGEIEEPTTFESHIIRVRLNRELATPKFFYYYFKSPVCRIRSIVTQGVQAGIRGNDLKKLKVHIPTLREQDRIASILSAYDDLIENNRRRIQLLEESARLLYKEWFVHLRFPGHEHAKITDGVPEEWEKSLLGDVVEVAKGRNITKETAKEGPVPVVAGGLAPAYYHDTPNALGPVITISASGANAGFVNLYLTDIWASDCSYISRSSTDIIYYVYLLLQSRQREISGMQRGAAQPHVYPKDLQRLPVACPPRKVLTLFEDLVANSFAMIACLQMQNEFLTKARDLLLPRLMNGEVLV